MRLVSLALTVLLCLLLAPNAVRADQGDEPEPAFAADQLNITTGTLESEGLQIRAIGEWMAARARLAHQKLVIAQAQTDFDRAYRLKGVSALSYEEFLHSQNALERTKIETDIIGGKIEVAQWSAELWKLRLLESGSGQDFRLPIARALLSSYQSALKVLYASRRQAEADHAYYSELFRLRNELVARKAVSREETEHALLARQEKEQLLDTIRIETDFMNQAVVALKKTIARLERDEQSGGAAPKHDNEIAPRRIDDARRKQR